MTILTEKEYHLFASKWAYYNEYKKGSLKLSRERLSEKLHSAPELLVKHKVEYDGYDSDCMICDYSWGGRSIYTAQDTANYHFSKEHPEWPMPQQERFKELIKK